MRVRCAAWMLPLLLVLVTCAPVRKSPAQATPVATQSVPNAAQSAPTAATPQAVASDTFSAGVMYWATPRPVLCKDWYVVIAGTVSETHLKVIPELAKQRFTEGTLKVERVLLSLPTEREAAPANFAYFKSDGFEGLKCGDKVIVFVNEYDGGYGIIEAAGTNSKLGIKVRSWDDPVVGAIEAITRDARMAKYPDDRIELLKDPKYAKIWREFSGKGGGGKGCWE